MFARLFGRKSPPRSTREMVRVLRAAAQFSDQPTEKSEYDAAADALDRVITAAERHSDAPSRDAFSYALGRAELDLGDKLAELIEVVKDTHMTVQSVHTAQGEQGAAVGALRAEFHDGMQAVGERLSEVEGRTMALGEKVAEHDRSRDRSLEDRRLLREDMNESKEHRAKIQTTLDTELPAIRAAIQDLNTRHGGQIASLATQLQEIQRLLEIAGQHEAGS
jgi:hypothetical protein